MQTWKDPENVSSVFVVLQYAICVAFNNMGKIFANSIKPGVCTLDDMISVFQLSV